PRGFGRPGQAVLTVPPELTFRAVPPAGLAIGERLLAGVARERREFRFGLAGGFHLALPHGRLFGFGVFRGLLAGTHHSVSSLGVRGGLESSGPVPRRRRLGTYLP